MSDALSSFAIKKRGAAREEEVLRSELSGAAYRTIGPFAFGALAPRRICWRRHKVASHQQGTAILNAPQHNAARD